MRSKQYWLTLLHETVDAEGRQAARRRYGAWQGGNPTWQWFGFGKKPSAGEDVAKQSLPPGAKLIDVQATDREASPQGPRQLSRLILTSDGKYVRQEGRPSAGEWQWWDVDLEREPYDDWEFAMSGQRPKSMLLRPDTSGTGLPRSAYVDFPKDPELVNLLNQAEKDGDEMTLLAVADRFEELGDEEDVDVVRQLLKKLDQDKDLDPRYNYGYPKLDRKTTVSAIAKHLKQMMSHDGSFQSRQGMTGYSAPYDD